MKKRNLLLVCIMIAVICLSCFAFAGCEKDNTSTENKEIKAIYDSYVVYAESEGQTPLSYEAWLDSIRGTNGTNGTNGLSAFEIWKTANPNSTLTEAQWLETLVGANGKNGVDGVGVAEITVALNPLTNKYDFEIKYTNQETTTISVDAPVNTKSIIECYKEEKNAYVDKLIEELRQDFESVYGEPFDSTAQEIAVYKSIANNSNTIIEIDMLVQGLEASRNNMRIEKAKIINEKIVSNVYNLGVGSTNFTYAELKESYSGLADSYYVPFAEVKDVESVTINGITYTKDSTFKLSIGNNNFIEDKAFIVKDNVIYFAAPIYSMELTNVPYVKIDNAYFNGINNSGINCIDVDEVDFQSGATSTYDFVDTNVYTLNMREGNKYISIYSKHFDDFDANPSTQDIVEKYVITRKCRMYSDGTYDVSYGVTNLDENKSLSRYELEFYPIGWNNNFEDVNPKFDQSIMVYTIFVPTRGVINVQFFINLVQE